MSPEENPTTNEADDFNVDEQPVEAQLADVADNSAAGENATPNKSTSNSITDFFVNKGPETKIGDLAAISLPVHQAPPPIAKSLQNISANGGAIGAMVLGLWCLVGSFVTNWSIINGFLGLLLGFWGLSSRKRKWAWIGIALCVLGVFLSLANISEIVNDMLNTVDENSVEF